MTRQGGILALLQKNHVVLSCEGWSNKPDDWNKISFFRKNNIDVTFIFYVRPPVNWMNSAWWQWGAWHSDDFDDWITQSIKGVKYGEKISSFNNLDWVKQIRVRLLDNDLLDDFAHILGLDYQSYQRDKSVINRSLPNGILRLFQKHRQLRPGPHANSIDFTLEKYLKLDSKADWVLEPAHIKKIIDETRDSNVLLLNFIDEDCKEKFLADQRYWDPAAFDGIQAKPAAGIKPTYKELEDIALAAIDAVMNLAAQQRMNKRG